MNIVDDQDVVAESAPDRVERERNDLGLAGAPRESSWSSVPSSGANVPNGISRNAGVAASVTISSVSVTAWAASAASRVFPRPAAPEMSTHAFGRAAKAAVIRRISACRPTNGSRVGNGEGEGEEGDESTGHPKPGRRPPGM